MPHTYPEPATPAARLLVRLDNCRATAPHAWMASCPAHPDKSPSLSVKETATGDCLIHCHAGCPPDAVCAALGLTLADLYDTSLTGRDFVPRSAPKQEVPRIVRTYPYTDEAGNVLYEVVRYEPKGFRQRRPDGAGGYVWNMDGVRKVPFALPALAASNPQAMIRRRRVVFIVEGEKDVLTLQKWDLVATTFVGSAGKWLSEYAEAFAGKNVVLLPDNDAPGRAHMRLVGNGLRGVARAVRVLELPGVKEKGDVSDWVAASPDHGERRFGELVEKAQAFDVWDAAQAPSGKSEPAENAVEASAKGADFREGAEVGTFGTPLTPVFATENAPEPLRANTLPVAVLSDGCLPKVLFDVAADIARRVGCPIEYAVAPLLVAVSALVGRKATIRPKRRDSWTVTPNLWGAVVGAPGSLKSPAAAEALRPLLALEKDDHARFVAETDANQVTSAVKGAQAEAAKDALRKAVRSGEPMDDARLYELADAARYVPDGDAVVRKRRVVNDVTVEKLGELLRDNPNGLLMYRDELSGFFKTLEKPGHETDRAFYLEAWNGDGAFDYDRIGRGNIHIPAVCVSLFGTIQPGVLQKFIRASDSADGLPQRLQILFYPDAPRVWTHTDELPDAGAHAALDALFARLAALPDGKPEAFQFADDAQTAWETWRDTLENRLLAATDAPSLMAHLSKYRSLLPSLALLFHLTDENADMDGVTLSATEQAIALCDCLQTHAARVYGSDNDAAHEGAVALLSKIKAGRVKDGFTARQVYRHHWAELNTPEATDAALALLAAHGYVAPVDTKSANMPMETWHIHPAVLAKDDAR